MQKMELEPETTTAEDEVVLDIVEIINHPDYSAEKGPLRGGDIAVYKVKVNIVQYNIDDIYHVV